MYNVLLVSYTVLLVVDFSLLMYSLGRRGTYAENGMSLALMANVFVQASLLIPLLSDDPAVCRICAVTKETGIVYLIVYAFVYLRQFVGNPIPPLKNGIVQCVPLLFALSQWIPYGEGTIAYEKIEYITYQRHLFCRLHFSIVGWLLVAVIGGGFYLASISILVNGIRKSLSSKWKEAMGFMLVLYIFPAVMGLMRIIGIFNVYTNPTYVALGIIAVAWGIYVTVGSKYNLAIEGEHLTFQRMETAAIVMDENKKFILANDKGYKIFPSLEGREGFDIRALFEFDIDDFEEGNTEEFEYGGEYYRAGIISLTDNAGVTKGYVLSLINITETFNFVGEIMELRDEAERANRAKSTFLANMSHEIRTPMNAIVGMSELIIEEARDEQEVEYARDIKTASQNLLRIINDILDISRVESGSMELANDPYMIEDLISEVYNIVRIPAGDKGLEIQTDIDPETPAEFYGDMGRIRQVMINIFNNAIKFTKLGGVSMHVSAERIEGENWNLRFSIEDTGIGISKEDMKKLFERFGRVDSSDVRKIEGSGLGLVIAKNFVDMMNGTIDVTSEPGKGSVFVVTVRQVCRDTAPVSGKKFGEEEDEEPEEMFESPGYSILIVDDNRVNLKVAYGMLSPYKFDIDQVTSGIDAIEKEEQNDYNMILMDHMMPEMDGIEATRHILESCQGTAKNPIMIALTANSFRGAKEMFRNNGFSDYLSKPIDKTDLHKLLCRWIPRDLRSPVSGTMETMDSAADAATITMQGIDVRSALSRHSGGISTYLEILELFYMDGKEKRPLIAELKANGDIKNYEIELHALKSAAANIGAAHLSEFAKDHETAAKSGDYIYINQECDAILEEYDAILSEIEKTLKKSGRLSEEHREKTRDYTESEIKDKIGEILELSEGFKSKEAQESLDELLSGRIDTDLEAKLNLIKNKFRMYDDDGAEDLLKEILDSM